MPHSPLLIRARSRLAPRAMSAVAQLANLLISFEPMGKTVTPIRNSTPATIPLWARTAMIPDTKNETVKNVSTSPDTSPLSLVRMLKLTSCVVWVRWRQYDTRGTQAPAGGLLRPIVFSASVLFPHPPTETALPAPPAPDRSVNCWESRPMCSPRAEHPTPHYGCSKSSHEHRVARALPEGIPKGSCSPLAGAWGQPPAKHDQSLPRACRGGGRVGTSTVCFSSIQVTETTGNDDAEGLTEGPDTGSVAGTRRVTP